MDNVALVIAGPAGRNWLVDCLVNIRWCIGQISSLNSHRFHTDMMWWSLMTMYLTTVRMTQY